MKTLDDKNKIIQNCLDKAEDLTIKKLTYKNPTMASKFAEHFDYSKK